MARPTLRPCAAVLADERLGEAVGGALSENHIRTKQGCRPRGWRVHVILPTRGNRFRPLRYRVTRRRLIDLSHNVLEARRTCGAVSGSRSESRENGNVFVAEGAVLNGAIQMGPSRPAGQQTQPAKAAGQAIKPATPPPPPVS